MAINKVMAMAVGIEKPAFKHKAQVSDEIQATEPTDRSIPAVKITKPAPTEIMPIIDTCLKMVVIVPNDKKLEEAIEKIAISKNKIRTMP